MNTNKLVIDTAGLHQMGCVVDHGDCGPNGFLVREVAGLGQDDHPGLNALRLLAIGNLARLVTPEDEGTRIEDVTL